jgi:hypothetical protein
MGQRMDDFLRDFMGKERADRIQEKRTGMTYAQRQIARDPNAEVMLLDFTDEEMEVWREGGDPFKVGPQPRQQRQAQMEP